MTDREVMQQALEALEFLSLDFFMLDPISPGLEAGNKAITALRAALAEPEPTIKQSLTVDALIREADAIVRSKPTWERFIDGTPLSNDIAVWMAVFAQDVARRVHTPPARRPLTDEDIWQVYYDLPSNDFESSDRVAFAHAIERAHGIKEER